MITRGEIMNEYYVRGTCSMTIIMKSNSDVRIDVRNDMFDLQDYTYIDKFLNDEEIDIYVDIPGIKISGENKEQALRKAEEYLTNDRYWDAEISLSGHRDIYTDAEVSDISCDLSIE